MLSFDNGGNQMHYYYSKNPYKSWKHYRHLLKIRRNVWRKKVRMNQNPEQLTHWPNGAKIIPKKNAVWSNVGRFK